MASRQEEKEARRKERQELERKEAAAAARRKRLQLVGGGVLAIAAIAAVVIAIAAAAGGDDEQEASAPASGAAAAGKLPEQQTSDFEEAAKAAGCTLSNPQYEGAGHEEKDFKPSDYKTNPPTSGTHFPDWYDDGVYEPGTTPQLGMLVHTLEHGRINVQYAPGTTKADRDKLEAFIADNGGYHMLLYQNPTDMPFKVAVTAWDQMLGCNEISDKTWDAFRTFRDRYIDKAPEKVA